MPGLTPSHSQNSVPDPAEALIQTKAQTYVRVLGVVAFFGCAMLGPILYFFAEPSKTRASVPRPEWSWDLFRSGKLAKALEVHLEESSPVTVALRTWHNDHLHRLAGLESDRAYMGRSEWVFLGEPGDRGREYIQRHAENRLQFLRRLKQECRRLAVALLCVPVPDKATVYPDYAYRGGKRLPNRGKLYALILAELATAELESVDLLAAFEAIRRANPERILYQPRDTHWEWSGARAGGEQVVDCLLQLGWDLGARVGYEPLPLVASNLPPDLLPLLGLLPGGAVSLGFPESARYTALRLRGPAGGLLPIDASPEGARLAVCGDSFGSTLAGMVRGYSGRLVDSAGVLPGKGPLAGLLALLEGLRRGESTVRVIVWTFVERSYCGSWWLDPADPAGG